MRLLRPVRAAADWIEQSPIGPGPWAGALAAIIAVRHFLEMATAQYPMYSPVQFFIHYPLAYLAPMLALTLLLSVFAGVRVERVARLMLAAWVLTLLPPLVDLALGQSHRQQIGYLAGGEQRFLPLLLRFFDPTVELPGTTRGIRIEAALACLLGGLYVRMKGRGWIRALACAVAILPTCLFFFTLPVRFYQACRVVFGDLPIPAIYGQTGRVASVPVEGVADMVVVGYLVPFVLTLLALFALAIKPDLLRAALSRLSGMPAVLSAVAALAGALAARGAAGPQPDYPAPAETLAVPLIGLSALFAAGALGSERDAEAGRTTVPLLLAGAAVALAGAAGAAPLALICVLAALAGMHSRAPLELGRYPVLGEVCAALAAVAAGAAGASVFFGREVIVRLPPALILALASSGALLRVSARGGEGPLRILRAVAAALAPLSFPLLLGEPRLLLPLLLVGAGAALVVAFTGASRAVGAFAPAVSALALLVGAILTIGSPPAASQLRSESLRSPFFHNRLGNQARARGDRAEAERAYREAVARDPRFVPALSHLAEMKVEEGDHDRAIGLFGEALEIDPDNAFLLNSLGAALMAVGRTGEALPRFERAVESDPADCRARYNLAVATDAPAAGGEPAAARQRWEEYLESCGGRVEEARPAATARRRLAELRDN